MRSRLSNLTRVCSAMVAVCLTAIATTTATAQITEYTFDLDTDASTIQIRGSVMGFALIGDREAAFDGALDLRVGNPAEPFLGFIIDDSTIIQIDPLTAKIKNPIPFFPPLGFFTIDDLTLIITSRVVHLDANGDFISNTGSMYIASGMITGELLGDPLDPVDLAGTQITPMPLVGALTQDGSIATLEFPFDMHIDTDDADVTISGGFVATTVVE